MLYGKVKWFNAIKGFGFITLNEYDDAFVHYTSIKRDGYRDLNDGQMVCFDLRRSKKGYIAENVEPYFLNERLRKHKKPQELTYNCADKCTEARNKK